jgi:hypothetical protein
LIALIINAHPSGTEIDSEFSSFSYQCLVPLCATALRAT